MAFVFCMFSHSANELAGQNLFAILETYILQT